MVTVVGREEIEVPAGRFRAVVVEMRVRDARRYRGEGTIRIHLSDDSCRLILRLESRVPDAGPATLSLQSYEGHARRASAQAAVDGDGEPRPYVSPSGESLTRPAGKPPKHSVDLPAVARFP